MGPNGLWVLDVGKNSCLVDVEELSKRKIEAIITKCNEVLKKKYRKVRNPKYGTMNKGFTSGEIDRFFSVQMNKKARACFQVMCFMGLRIGEANKLQLDDVDFNNNRLRINTEKARTTDFMYMPDQVRSMLWWGVQDYQKRIAESQGYLFFSDNQNSDRLFVSADWLRKEFRRVCGLADLTETYGRRVNDQGRLHRHTTHSFRHFFVRTIYQNTKDLIKTQCLLRHQDTKAAQVYIHTDQAELDCVMASVFGEVKKNNLVIK